MQELRKRGVAYPSPQDITCTEEDSTFPVCHEGQMPRALQVTSRGDHEIGPCNAFLHFGSGFKSFAKCAGKSFLHWKKGHKCRHELWHDFKVDIKHPKTYAKAFVKAHLKELDISFEVFEEIDVRFQLEIAGTVAVSFWFDVDLWTQEFTVCDPLEIGVTEVPVPFPPGACWKPVSPIKPSFGWFFSLDGGSPTGPVPLSGLPAGGEVDSNGKPKAIGSKMGSAKTSFKDTYDSKKASFDAMKDSAGSTTVDPAKVPFGIPLPTLDLTPVGISTSLTLEMGFNL